MADRRMGQPITFAIELDEDAKIPKWITIPVRKGDTVRKIAARRAHLELARQIADHNKIRSVKSVLGRKTISVPGVLRADQSFDVLPGDQAPRVASGYAKYDTVDRPQRVGLTVFSGYDPISLEIAIRFDNVLTNDGVQIEKDCTLLEYMAGRGQGPGVAVGPPPVIRVSVTGTDGNPVPLIPRNYQWALNNKTAPLWRIANLDWDADPLRNDSGNRIRQLATVTLQQHTVTTKASKSAAQRAKGKPAPAAKGASKRGTLTWGPEGKLAWSNDG